MKDFIKYISILVCFFMAEQNFAQKTFFAPSLQKMPHVQAIDSTQLIYEVYLLGDIKPYPKVGRDNLHSLKKALANSKTNSAVVLLGDIVYPVGLPSPDEENYLHSKQSLDSIIYTFDNYKHPVYIFAGNHDWAQGRPQGWQHVQNLEKYITEHAPKNIQFLPKEGCPGPIEIHLSDDITLVFFDSQWWFHQNEKPKPSDCNLQDENEIFAKVEDILKRNKDKKVIVAAHHPLYSVGNHGGYFPLSRNLFPLLDANKSMYIPLPGFLYTGYRKYFGDIQDLAHPKYKFYRKTLRDIFRKYPNTIYASGHEHNMQYFVKDSLFHIVSGGGGPTSYIARKKKKADFAYEGSGFVKLSFLKNGDVWISYLNNQGKVILQQNMFNKTPFNPKKIDSIKVNYHPTQDSITVRIADRYIKAGKFQRKMLGDNYRDIWNTPIKIPVFNIGKEKGGLTILKRGGGMQTLSVRLQAKNGKQYVLRSVDKDPSNALPGDFRNTFVEKPVQDAISASNPFGALTVPPLADALGVMHTNPKLVWVPNDPRLGVYQTDLANKVFLFEERPSGDWHDAQFFGYSKKIVSTPKTIKKTQDKHKHIVDQKAVLKARLLDILLNDWDRHDDQWRWATFKENGKTIYRPIPRDRDQVYFVNQGIAMWLATRKWSLRKFQGFSDTITDIAGLNFNARYFDRSFLTELNEKEWQKIAETVKKQLTDSVIHQAMLKMPPEIMPLQANTIEKILQKRRNDLPAYASQYYKILAKTIDVVGTNKDEFFDVVRQNDGTTKVQVFAIDKKTEKPKDTLYNRTFYPDETQEIRLYGLAGKDRFYIKGRANKGIKVRVVGGKGKDSIIDTSNLKSWAKKTLVYDRKDKKNTIIGGKETKLFLSKHKSINKYDRMQFNYNKTIPLILGGYNADDGLFLGGGVKIIRYHFRGKTTHDITAYGALASGAYKLSYHGLFTAVSPFYDLSLDAKLSMPEYVHNFFGLGNETIKQTDDASYYRVRYHYASLNPMVIKNIDKNWQLKTGLVYRYYEVTDTLSRFVGNQNLSNLPNTDYKSAHYFGANLKLNWDTRDEKIQPKRGVHWLNTASYLYNNDLYQHLNVKSDFSLYLSVNKDPRMVTALRFGGAKNWGNYAFYHANYLGADSNLRGYKNQRFGGDSYLYQNTEIRFKLGKIRNYIINGATGFSVFNDFGRVWYQELSSTKWHQSYGVEYWLVPYDLTVIRLSLSHSEEENLFINFKFSYQF